MKTVLITGATGDVGTHLAREFAGKYKLRLSDRRPLKAKNFVKADISKMADALRITKGVDAIVHLGGYSVEGPWEGILQANIIGCYNVFEAARRNGVKRILFPTSNHAVGFYRRDQTIDQRRGRRPGPCPHGGGQLRLQILNVGISQQRVDPRVIDIEPFGFGRGLARLRESPLARKPCDVGNQRVEPAPRGGAGVLWRRRASRRVAGARRRRRGRATRVRSEDRRRHPLLGVGAGHGHGVGMSQWGAEGMARHGADYRRILATFFPGTELSQGWTR